MTSPEDFPADDYPDTRGPVGLKLAIAFFVLAVAIGIALAVWTSVNSDKTADPVRDPQPIQAPTS